MNLVPYLAKVVKDAEIALAEAKRQHAEGEMIAAAVDSIVWPEGTELSSEYANFWSNRTSITQYLVVKSIPALMDNLEKLETMFDAEFDSYDTEDGVRRFRFTGLMDTFRLELIVTPGTDSEDSTCRKILIGEDTHTEVTKTPRYRIQCNEGDSHA